MLKPGETFSECVKTDGDYSKYCPQMVVVPYSAAAGCALDAAMSAAPVTRVRLSLQCTIDAMCQRT
jgi:hypothetical protein